MTISIWRYSHLALAVSSFVFVVLASVTGIILAFEPIVDQVKPYRATDFDQLNLAQTLGNLQARYDEIIELKIDANEFVLIDAISEDGESINGYVDPNTGDYLGPKIEKSRFFQFITNFHRSLFLKSIGRAFIGITSFLLFLIAVSGVMLVIRRQRGIKHFFKKIINEDFAQYWHVVLGRLSLLPIIVVTLTGVYLSLITFGFLPQFNASHNIDYESIEESPKMAITSFKSLKEIPLKEVRAVEFPFSTDVEDFYTIRLKKHEFVINQFTGKVISKVNYPIEDFLADLSLRWHTGQGSIFWALILAIACFNILFFIWSGFRITLKRRKSKLRNHFNAHTAEVIILVGSENGSTIRYASVFHEQLLKSGIKSYIDQLNNYKNYSKAHQLIVFTATYGLGDPPSNASGFLTKLNGEKQLNTLRYTVVGFGSLAYPDFCKFAYEVDKALGNTDGFNQLLPITTINDGSVESFDQWVFEWSNRNKVSIDIPKEKLWANTNGAKSFLVKQKTKPNDSDNTFLIALEPKGKQSFVSGDLLAIYPENDYRERLYSIGKMNRQAHLSVKLHELGLGSSYLNKLQENQSIKARVITNSTFHFPKKASKVVMIANGTGIAPFLGMLHENKRKLETHLFWGGRTKDSYGLYGENLEQLLEHGKLNNINICYSQEGAKEYVQHKISKNQDLITKTLDTQGVIMICGSLAMQNEVMDILEGICKKFLNTPIETYLNNKQIRTDCY
ncbi:PepSY domain-containing protein [Flagellimonas pacifica]|uniref:NADPH--hemoprotein reductase n=1 Tax=Flagellimonas pacifica TaxID=1247520 RepID=A0A285MUH1_9FLAO|nr:PepSY domain-containing protein [Allomuricauda parva]SNZ00814.1 sulfite reductase (NADPH) flavoprotein alpha-component [Allomuricauda parva]